MPFPGKPVFQKYDYPCTKDCPERSVTCHGTCKRYLDARAANEKERQEIRKKAKYQDDYDNYKNNIIENIRESKRRRK